MGEVCNELSEVPYHPHKLLDRGIRVWLWEVNDGLDMLFHWAVSHPL